MCRFISGTPRLQIHLYPTRYCTATIACAYSIYKRIGYQGQHKICDVKFKFKKGERRGFQQHRVVWILWKRGRTRKKYVNLQYICTVVYVHTAGTFLILQISRIVHNISGQSLYLYLSQNFEFLYIFFHLFSIISFFIEGSSNDLAFVF